MIRSKSNMRFQVLANFILILFTIFVITPFILLIMSSFSERFEGKNDHPYGW